MSLSPMTRSRIAESPKWPVRSSTVVPCDHPTAQELFITAHIANVEGIISKKVQSVNAARPKLSLMQSAYEDAIHRWVKDLKTWADEFERETTQMASNIFEERRKKLNAEYLKLITEYLPRFNRTAEKVLEEIRSDHSEVVDTSAYKREIDESVAEVERIVPEKYLESIEQLKLIEGKMAAIRFEVGKQDGALHFQIDDRSLPQGTELLERWFGRPLRPDAEPFSPKKSFAPEDSFYQNPSSVHGVHLLNPETGSPVKTRKQKIDDLNQSDFIAIGAKVQDKAGIEDIIDKLKALDSCERQMGEVELTVAKLLNDSKVPSPARCDSPLPTRSRIAGGVRIDSPLASGNFVRNELASFSEGFSPSSSSTLSEKTVSQRLREVTEVPRLEELEEMGEAEVLDAGGDKAVGMYQKFLSGEEKIKNVSFNPKIKIVDDSAEKEGPIKTQDGEQRITRSTVKDTEPLPQRDKKGRTETHSWRCAETLSCKSHWPLDIAVTDEGICFVTAPETGKVLILKDGDAGSLRNSTPFKRPRNITFIPDHKQVLVLDEQGIHFFDDKGQTIKTIMSEESLKFRGLAWFRDESKIHLATMEAENGATHVVVIDLEGEMGIKKRVPITTATADSKCRFIQVSGNAAFVTDIGTRNVYRTDLTTGESKTIDLAPKPQQPAGIDVFGDTVFIADAGNGNVSEFDISGEGSASLKTLPPPEGMFKPLGIKILGKDHMFVVNSHGKNVLKYSRCTSKQ